MILFLNYSVLSQSPTNFGYKLNFFIVVLDFLYITCNLIFELFKSNIIFELFKYIMHISKKKTIIKLIKPIIKEKKKEK